MKGRVSVIIPSCNERHLQVTIDSVLAGARGDVEVFACLDAWRPDPPLKDDPRVKVLHWPARTHMRPMENAAAEAATGEFLFKLDSHCILAPGWDASLKAHCEPGDLVVPTRHSIDEASWTLRPRDFNYSYLTWPFALSMYGYGLHAKTFGADVNRAINSERADVPVDDLMSFQGSAWFQRKADFDRLGPLDHDNYYFYQEAQETGLRVWMSGGRCRIDKTTWYAHLHKGKDNVGADGRQGRGFFLDVRRKRASEAFAADFWLNDRWPGATRTFVQFVERFQWLLDRVPDPREQWPADWRDFEKHRGAFLARPADQIPAHT